MSTFPLSRSAAEFRVFCLFTIFIGSLISVWAQADPGFSTVFKTGDSPFPPSISKVVMQPDGRILIVGFFTHVDLQERNRMARLLSNGSVDTSFVPDVFVQDFVLLPDGKLVVYEASGSNRLIRRLNSDGSIDATFTPITFSNGIAATNIRAMALGPDGRIYVGGDFNLIGGVARRMLARLNSDGTVDQSFADVDPSVTITSTQPLIFALLPRPDGKVFVGGRFKDIAGVTRPGIVLLNNDGTADTSFNAERTEEQFVNRITQVEDGKLLLGSVNDIRVMANGSADSSFAPSIFAWGCTPQVAGKYVCGGNRSPDTDTALAVRVNASDGSVDPTFSTIGIRNSPSSFVVQPDGKILAYGSFQPADVKARKWPRALARLEINGALDEPAVSRADFSGDLQTDVSVFRPSTGQWFVRTGGWFTTVTWGVSTDRIVPADYDGDGKTDYAVFRAADSNWYVINSGDFTFSVNPWGTVGDVPLAADYDGDRMADRMIYRPSESNWYLLSSKYGIRPVTQFGAVGDTPVIGDFDGDNLTDLTTFRPSDTKWRVLMTTSDAVVSTQWGEAGDVLTPGDYDGDRVTDFAVYRPSNGRWYHRKSGTPGDFESFPWGIAGDVPVSGDYDGDRITDRAIFRPLSNTWYILGSQSGWQVIPFGESGDTPIPRNF